MGYIVKKCQYPIESSLLIVFGIAVIIASSLIDYRGALVISPGFFPTLLGILIIILACALVFRKHSMKKAKKSITSEIIDEEREVKHNPSIKVIALIGSCFIYILLLKYIGFIIATILFIAIVSMFLGERRWWMIILLSVLGSLFIYLIFEIGFKVYLP